MTQPQKALHVLMVKNINTDVSADAIVKNVDDAEKTMKAIEDPSPQVTQFLRDIKEIGLHIPGDYQQMHTIIDNLNKTQDQAHALQRSYEEEIKKESVDKEKVKLLRTKKEVQAEMVRQIKVKIDRMHVNSLKKNMGIAFLIFNTVEQK